MIGNRKPSYQNAYDLFWSGDDAIAKLPPGAGKKKQEEHYRKLRVARETGDWTPVLVGGANPTKFSMHQVKGEYFRRLIDRRDNHVIGEAEARSFLFRMALSDITNMTGPDGEPMTVAMVASEYGQIASTDVTNYLDSINEGIVNELGMVVFARIVEQGKS